MSHLVRSIVLLFFRLVLRCRYRVHLRGMPQPDDLTKPILILPNHPAMVDPILLISLLDGPFHPRTVLYEGNFSSSIRNLLVSILRAVPIPDLRQPSQTAHQKTEQAVAEIIAGLRRGENFILWPSGRAQRDGVERLGAVRALSDTLAAVPDASVLLVRTRGLWGSMFSFAPTGRLPDLTKCLMNGALLLLSNLLFFTPRRDVEITFELLDRKKLPSLERTAVNRWFEGWYNAEGAEQPRFVPYHFLFGPREFQFPPLQSAESQLDLDQVPEAIRNTIAEILSAELRRTIAPTDLNPATSLDELGLDSLQRMDVALEVEHRFSKSVDSSPETVGQLLAMAQGITETKPLKPPAEWLKPPKSVTPLQILGETIPEAFVTRALSTPTDVAVADNLSGTVTYGRLLTAALLMAVHFRKLPEHHVGLMLPASVACDTMLMGLYLANKLPVLLNWTTGAANLQHAAQLTELTHVISSRQMRDRLNIKLEGVQFIDVEDLKKQVSWFAAARTMMLVRCFPGMIRSRVPHLSTDSTAVILFTSGSEKAPKAVPLTHGNVVSNVRIVPAILNLTNQDAVLGFLPMFHSFGFTMTGLFPLLGGIRVIHHADPTDASGLARKIAAYAPTVMVSMPSLVARIFERARPGELDSLRLIAVGAEKCPQELFDKVHQDVPGAVILEGYGITECSPAVAANRPGAIREGTIGQPLPGVEVCVVDLETDEKLPPEQMGMLLVSGPGVFPGYLGDEKSPFVTREGKRWYVTGDLVEIDRDGFIRFSGRLKRFIKAGGEMISLPALEEPFIERFPPDANGPRVAVEGIETDSGRQVVLFTKESIDLAAANSLLLGKGFRGIMRLDEVRHLDEIPVLGTGKIDYRKLRSQITESASGKAPTGGNSPVGGKMTS